MRRWKASSARCGANWCTIVHIKHVTRPRLTCSTTLSRSTIGIASTRRWAISARMNMSNFSINDRRRPSLNFLSTKSGEPQSISFVPFQLLRYARLHLPFSGSLGSRFPTFPDWFPSPSVLCSATTANLSQRPVRLILPSHVGQFQLVRVGQCHYLRHQFQ